MFTGIVEETGSIRSLRLSGSSGKIAIRAKKVLGGTRIGDSIAVNGVCLTVVSLEKDGFTADVMAETVRRTNLGDTKIGEKVNLERAMAADGRFGGHIVAGHIDGTGMIEELRKEENAVWVKIRTTPEILELIVEKGSICIDGISLTVAEVSEKSFQVSVIPAIFQNLIEKSKLLRNLVFYPLTCFQIGDIFASDFLCLCAFHTFQLLFQSVSPITDFIHLYLVIIKEAGNITSDFFSFCLFFIGKALLFFILDPE